MKITKYFLLIVCFFTIVNTNNSYGLSIPKPADNSGKASALKYLKASEFVKLSAKQFSKLTGKKMSIADKLSFKILKLKLKHDLKKNPDLQVKDYYTSKKSTTFKILKWVLIGIALFFLLFLLFIGIETKTH